MAYSLAIAMPYRYLLPPTRLWHALRLCLLVLCWLPMAAMARDYVSARAYWTDTTASASLEQAQAQSFMPFQNILSKGFSTSVQWIRLTGPSFWMKLRCLTRRTPTAPRSPG